MQVPRIWGCGLVAVACLVLVHMHIVHVARATVEIGTRQRGLYLSEEEVRAIVIRAVRATRYEIRAAVRAECAPPPPPTPSVVADAAFTPTPASGTVESDVMRFELALVA